MKRIGILNIIISFTLIVLSPWTVMAESAGRMTVDGQIWDWMDIPAVDTDREDDSSQPSYNFTAVYAARSKGALFIRIDVKGDAVLDRRYRLFIDADNNRSTGFSSSTAKIEGIDYMVIAASLYKFNGRVPSAWSWEDCGEARNAAGNSTIELAIPLDVIKASADGKIKLSHQFMTMDLRFVSDLLPDSGSILLEIESLPVVEELTPS